MTSSASDHPAKDPSNTAGESDEVARLKHDVDFLSAEIRRLGEPHVGPDGKVNSLRVSYDKLHALATENKELRAENDALRAALTDMLGGWKYIRRHHGDLYGVGWDRCEQAAEAALAPANPSPETKKEGRG